MAYTIWDELTPVSTAASFDERLEYCTAAEDSAPAPFYVEDILLLMAQSGCASISKKMATFWGQRRQVWVGHDSSSNVLKDVVALQCPPYYPPHTTQGVMLEERDKPAIFP